MTRSVFNHRRAAASRYASEVLADNPLLYWRLGEASGSTAEDATANNRDGTYQNTGNISYAQTGAIANDPDTAVEWQNASPKAYVNRAASTDWDTTDLTIETWVKTTATEVNFAHLAQVGGTGGSPTWRWVLCIRQTTANEPLQIRGSGFAATGPNADTGGFTAGIWYHVAATWNSTDWEFYLDGSSLGTYTGTGPAAITNRDFSVGDDGAGGANHLIGSQDEVALYDYALSSARIAAHYAAAL